LGHNLILTSTLRARFKVNNLILTSQ